MTTFRVLAIASFVTLFGCTSEDDTVDCGGIGVTNP